MSEKIEFVGLLTSACGQGAFFLASSTMPSLFTSACGQGSDVLPGRKREFHVELSFLAEEIDVANAMLLVGERYRVTLEPIEPELRPCPFCGGEAALFDDRNGVRMYQARCLECSTGRTLWANVKADAIAAWNRRTP